MTAVNYPWKEDDGVWRRKLGSMESFYLALTSPEGMQVHWMIGCCVSLKYEGDSTFDILHVLRHAWRHLRSNFPNIAATIHSETKTMVVEIEVLEEEWLQRSFKVHESGTANELFEEFKSQSCITLHWLHETKEVLIQAPHSLIDGRGILYLYHALFTTLSGQSSISLESRLPNLTRPYDDWLNISAVPSEKNLHDTQAIFDRVLNQEHPIRIPGINLACSPGKPIHQELILDEKTTEAIILACKQKGFSVTSAWHAALALAVQKIQAAAGEEGTTYAQFTTIDLRRYFPSPFSPTRHSIGSLQTALPLCATLLNRTAKADKASFSELAHSLHTQYRSPFSFTTSATNSSPDFNFLAPLMSASIQILSSSGIPPSTTPSLSSMGIVSDILKEKYGKWDVGTFWISSTVMTGDIQMYCWTFREQMTFSVCCNEAFYATDLVDTVLKGTKEEMLDGLKICR